MAETIMQKYERILGLVSVKTVVPLLEAVAIGQWDRDDSIALSHYLTGMLNERKRCSAMADAKAKDTGDLYLSDLAIEIRGEE